MQLVIGGILISWTQLFGLQVDLRRKKSTVLLRVLRKVIIPPTVIPKEKIIAARTTQRLLLLGKVVALNELGLPIHLAGVVIVPKQLLALGQDEVLLLRLLFFFDAKRIDVVYFSGLIFVLSLNESLARAVANLSIVFLCLVGDYEAWAEGAVLFELFVFYLFKFVDILLEFLVRLLLFVLHSFQCIFVCFA